MSGDTVGAWAVRCCLASFFGWHRLPSCWTQIAPGCRVRAQMLAFARSNAKESDCILIQGVIMTILPSIMSTSHLAQGCRAGVHLQPCAIHPFPQPRKRLLAGHVYHTSSMPPRSRTLSPPAPQHGRGIVTPSTSLAKGNLVSTHMRRVHFSLQAWNFGRPRTSEFAAPRKGLPRHPSLELSLRAEPNRW